MGQLRAMTLTTCLSGLAILLSLGLGTAHAQTKPAIPKALPVAEKPVVVKPAAANSEKKDDQAGETSILPQPDREVLKQLKDARFLIEKERFGEAVRILGNILSLPEDSFFTSPSNDPKEQTQIRGLHDEAEQILNTLPQRAIELYELQFGAQAKHLLQKAIQDGDTRAPADISRRFFRTAAGAEATWLSGLISMDEGRWKATVLAFVRLEKIPAVANRYEPLLSFLKVLCMEQAGQHETAEQTWQALRKRSPEASVQFGGKAISLFTNADETFAQFLARADLSDLEIAEDLRVKFTSGQTLPFGTPQRNPSVDAGLPLLKHVWRARITDRPLAETLLQKQREACIDSGTISIPRFHPLIVDGVLFGRTLNTLIAIDTKTGKRLWEAKLDEADETVQEFITVNARPSTLLQNLVRRIWDNSIYGQLSSDGQNIYAIEESNVVAANSVTRRQVQAIGMGAGVVLQNRQSESGNSLVAFDTKTGQRRWARSTDLNDLPLFFLGPPLPLDGSLYVLAENQEEIHLLAIAAASGEIDWSQRIAITEKPNSRHVNARYRLQSTNARMPAVADGIMVCPTGTGAIVAMEPTTRTLLWAHCYQRLGKRQNQVAFVNGIPRVQNQNRIGEELLLHNGQVFTVPADSNYLYCLDLDTGKELWKKDFASSVYLGGVYKDRLLVVGPKDFQTINTKDGKEIDTCNVQKSLGQEDTVLIMGHGFRNQGIYYAPTSSHHIVAFDIETGKITKQTYTHEPLILGNLVAAEDRIFSQSVDGIEAFHQLNAIRTQTEEQLHQNPNDLDAIAMQGELLLAEEKIDLAIEKFRHVHRTQPTPTSSDRLLKAFYIALKDSYPQYRDARPEIESLLQTESQKNKYWYLCIRGEMEENHLEAAAEACFELANLADQAQSMLADGRHHTVRQDRFVQAQLATIYEKLDPEPQKKLAQKILARFNAAIQSGDELDLHRAWNCYASLPPVVKRYWQTTEQIWKTNPTLAELILERTVRFGDPPEAATTMVHWAELLRSSDRFDEAAACYREAIHQWRDVPLLSNPKQTAATKIAALPADDPVRSRLAARDAWPEGYQVEKTKKAASPNTLNNIHGTTNLTPIGRPSPIFRDKQILFSGQTIELRDQYNRKVWDLSLIEEGSQDSIYYGSQGIRCSTLGHLILLELPNRVIAIDAWDSKQPKIAWQAERGASIDLPGLPNVTSNFRRVHFAGFTQGMFSSNRTPLGIPGLDFGFQLLTLSGTELIALDPFDGTPLWTRRKIPTQIDLNSNGTTLFVSQPHRHTEPTTMIQLVDGSPYVPPQKKTPAPVSNKKQQEEITRKAAMLAKQLFMKTAPQNTRNSQKILSQGRNILTFNRVSREYQFALVDCLTQKPIWGPKKYNYRSRWGLLDQDYIGVIDPEGRFQLFRISDGKTIVSQALKLDGTLQGIFLQNLGDRIGVIVSTNPKSNERNNNMSYIPITQYLQQGRIYSFHWDGRPGMSEQKDGILVKQQGFLANPPSKLPVITMMSQNYNQNNPEHPWTTKFQIIDSRSGKTILSEEIAASIQAFEITGNPQDKTINCQLNNQDYSIQFK